MQDDPLDGLQAITFRSHVLTDRLRDLARFALDFWHRAAILQIEEVAIGDEPQDTSTAWHEIPNQLARDCDDAKAENRTAEIILAGHMLAALSLFCGADRPHYCSVELTLLRTAEFDLRAGRSFQALCTRFSAVLIRHFNVHSLRLLPVGPGLRCLPEPALVDSPTHLLVVTEQAVDAHYDRPAEFWGAGWTVEAEHRDQRLLARDLDVIAGPDYLERIIEHQWAMARAAKPGETGYPDPEVLPEEEAMFRDAPKRLERVGYAAETGVIEYACVLTQGQHISGWEIFALKEIITSGREAAIGPAKSVRIVFPEQWMAESEKRPLLDIGCEVAWRGSDGALNRVED